VRCYEEGMWWLGQVRPYVDGAIPWVVEGRSGSVVPALAGGRV
jgi:hypothetical protein